MPTIARVVLVGLTGVVASLAFAQDGGVAASPSAPAASPAPSSLATPAPAAAPAPVAPAPAPPPGPDEIGSGSAPQPAPTPEPAPAPAPREKPRGLFKIAFSLRAAGGSFTPMPLDESFDCGPGSVACAGGSDLGARLRLMPEIVVDTLKVVAGIDLLLGNYYGKRDEIRDSVESFHPTAESVPPEFRVADGLGLSSESRLDLRYLYVEYGTDVGLLRLGQMGSNWGLGILANDGSRTPTFGEPRSGDVVERLQFITTPFVALSSALWAERTIVAIGADVVLRDEHGWLKLGERAIQGVVAVLYRRAEDRMAGLYVAYRHQDDRAGTKTRAVATDLYATWKRPLGDRFSLVASGEAVLVNGQTTRILSSAGAPVAVLALGAVGRVGIAEESGRFGADVEVGYASGDNDTGDELTRRFKFDPEYKVGLVLFDRVLARSTAQGAARVADPRRGLPPLGIAQLPTGGAVSGAAYLASTLRYRSRAGLGVNLLVMYAEATGDLVDPLASTPPGGGNHTLYGAPAENRRDLGLEVDVGLDYTLTRPDDWGLSLSLQYGHLFPGSAFANRAGTPMAGVDAFLFRVSLPLPEGKR